MAYRSECMRTFCSANAKSSKCKQLSGPKLMSSCWNPAPLRGIGESSGCVKMMRSVDIFDNWIRMLGDGNCISSTSCVMNRSMGTSSGSSYFVIR